MFSTKGDGTLTFYTGCKVDENWVRESGIDFSNREQIFEWFRKEFGTWNETWQELFMSEDSSFVVRPQYHYPLDQKWETLPNLTTLGDAAHRMPPYAGEGVNMAMQDAYELAECLTSNKYDTVQDALSHYENQMLKRASEITRVTLDNTVLMHEPKAIEKLMKMFNGD
ncbi:FAD-dependent monooxygenase [Chryseobacterium sp. Chry.R1]|uniref:FAD-dependent oxidoreductase n=1 Tax=Chryseobacterium sp. Chry.R1 TaxID=3139392 RepID=UPI0031F7BAEE